jgi:hypothetical protein
MVQSEADVLNRIERRVRKKKATPREKRILAEAYYAYGTKIPKDIRGQLD